MSCTSAFMHSVSTSSTLSTRSCTSCTHCPSFFRLLSGSTSLEFCLSSNIQSLGSLTQVALCVSSIPWCSSSTCRVCGNTLPEENWEEEPLFSISSGCLTHLRDPNYSSLIYSSYFCSCYSRPSHMKLRCIMPVKKSTPKTLFYRRYRDHSQFHSSSPTSGLQWNQNHKPHSQCNRRSRRHAIRNSTIPRSLSTSVSIL